MTLSAVIWHYWIGLVLLVSAIALVAAVGAGYLAKVVRPKYPRRSAPPTTPR
ncbi:MAG: hypothetical protein ACRD0G_11175 [Acidimicrobiales bacterium]